MGVDFPAIANKPCPLSFEADERIGIKAMLDFRIGSNLRKRTLSKSTGTSAGLPTSLQA
jgi:hypothetical protein